MQREEFESLTGFRPTLGMYKVIEQEYMNSEQDKAEFCRAYSLNIDGIAEKIQRLADMAEINQQQEMSKLQEQLDRELEWKYCLDLGTYLDQEEYLEICEECGCGECNFASDEYATQMLCKIFGFMPEQIKIRHEAEEFEVNKYGNCRVKRTFQRKPVYDTSDCNYIRFDCACRQWELINGELISYKGGDSHDTQEISAV